MRYLLILLLSPTLSFTKIKALPGVPIELKLLTESLPENIPEKLQKKYIKSFNEGLAKSLPKNKIFITKSEIYKFVLNKSSEKGLESKIKRIKNNYKKLSTFSQWIFETHISREQKSLKKSQSYWINALEKSLENSHHLKKQYLNLFVHIKSIFEALPKITTTKTSSEIFFKYQQEDKKTKKDVKSNFKETIDQVFQKK